MNTKLEYPVGQNRKLVTPKQIATVYNSVGFRVSDDFSSRDDFMDVMYGPGCFGFFVFQEKQLIAAARVMSDDVICSWLAELCVHPDWQNKGVDRSIIQTINERFSHTSLYLEAFSGQQGFFKKMDIKPREILVACSRARVNESL